MKCWANVDQRSQVVQLDEGMKEDVRGRLSRKKVLSPIMKNLNISLLHLIQEAIETDEWHVLLGCMLHIFFVV